MAVLLTPYKYNIQKPAKSLDCLLGEVTRPNENRLSETRNGCVTSIYGNEGVKSGRVQINHVVTTSV